MNTFKAESAQQLLSFAKSLEIYVPPRGEGRHKEHTEAWSTRSLLVALAETHHIKYPVTVVSNDKPDLDIIFENDKVGVEITEAIPVDYARVEVLAKRKYPDAIVDRSLFSWGRPRKSNSELHNILRASSNKLNGPGWESDSVEQEWAYAIFDTICIKIEKINKEEYRAFPRYWLLIYDNLQLPDLSIRQGVGYLRNLIPQQPKKDRMFQYIFIEVNFTLVAISKRGQLRYFEFDLH